MLESIGAHVHAQGSVFSAFWPFSLTLPALAVFAPGALKMALGLALAE